jgi:hypothetical protein
VVAILGAAGGNDTTLIRQEALLLLEGVAATLLSVLSLQKQDIPALAWALLAAGVVASVKTLALNTVAPTSVDVSSAYNVLNAQFGVQRVILIGGDTLIALSIPVGVGLLRSSRGPALILASLALPLTLLGVVLTYTRTLLGAALFGAAVAWALPSVRRRAHWQPLIAITGVSGLSVYLLNLTFGQSQFSAGAALLRRLLGGEDVGASTLNLRLADAAAAIGDPGVLFTGRGLGATFLSPISPNQPAGYVHMGYPWLILKGGLPLAALAIGLLIWSTMRLASAARSSTDPRMFAPLAGLVGATAAFAAINILVNRFDAVEGIFFMGTIVAVAWIVPKVSDGKVSALAGLTDRQEITREPRT